LAISPGDDRDLAPWIAALGDAGLSALLLREPQRTTQDLRRLVAVARRRLAPAAGAAEPQIWVHQRHPQAEDLGATGLHAPAGQAPRRRPFGASCHDPGEIQAALSAGATYVLLSPVWAPLSKQDPRAPLGLERFLAWARGAPALALGGVDPERAGLVLRQGFGVALMGALFGQPSPAAAGRALTQVLAQDPQAQRGTNTKTSGS
jgi:thiamine monophosphate synthase